MIVGTRKIVYSWPLLMLLAWMLGCGRTQSEIRAAQAPTSSLPLSDVVTDNNPHEPETFQPVPALSLPPVKTQFIHKVRWPRETLFSIARWYTGSGHNWHQLAAANPTVRPRAIHIGDVILIPEGLLKTRLPMPPLVARPRPTGGKKKPLVKQDPVPDPKIETLKLYGPIDRNPQTVEPKSNTGLSAPLETLD